MDTLYDCDTFLCDFMAWPWGLTSWNVEFLDFVFLESGYTRLFSIALGQYTLLVECGICSVV